MNDDVVGDVSKRLAPLLLAHGLIRLEEWHWARKFRELVQHVFFSTRKSGNIQVSVFIQSIQNVNNVVGGRLTPSSILQGGSIGGDCSWQDVDSGLPVSEAIGRSIANICMPIFDSLLTDQQLGDLTERFAGTDWSIELSSEDLRRLQSADVSEKFTEPKYGFVKMPKMRGWLEEKLTGPLSDRGFELHDDSEIVFFRDRGEFHDVLRMKQINFGMHFGVQLFHWWPEMALDGSTKFTSENSMILNGGAIDLDGKVSSHGSGFLLGNQEAALKSCQILISLLDSVVVPYFKCVSDWATFVKTIDPRLVETAKRIPGLKARFEPADH